MFNKISLLVFLVFGLLVGTSTTASDFEWINPFDTDSLWAIGYNQNVDWTSNTTDNYYEYRTVYFATTTSETAQPSDPGWEWTELTSCRHEGYVNGTLEEHCDATIYSGVDGHYNYLWVRATINYSGCGTYTPTPSNGCGDYREKRVLIDGYP